MELVVLCSLMACMCLHEIRYVQKGKDKQTVAVTVRKFLHRLIVAYAAGRPVDLQGLLQYELMPLPEALAEMNGMLRTG